MGVRNKVFVLMVGLVAGAVVLAGIAAIFLLRPPAAPLQPRPIPPSSGYGVYLFVDEVTTPSNLGRPTHDYWLQVNLTVRNTGRVPFSLTYRDWTIRDAGGQFSANPDQYMYGSQTYFPGQYVTYWLRFDLNRSAHPDRVILLLPNGHDLGVPLSGGPRGIGILLFRSNDGTNWSLMITSGPPRLATSGTTLTILTATGESALVATAFSALSYPTVQVAYMPAGNGTDVSFGDRMLISTFAYPAGCSFQISNNAVVLTNGTFPS